MSPKLELIIGQNKPMVLSPMRSNDDDDDDNLNDDNGDYDDNDDD